MKTQTRFLRHLSILLLAPALLAACQVEGGIPETAATAPSSTQPAGPDPAQAQAVAARKATWTIGMTDQPELLTPYQASAAEQRRAAPVSELLFPSPVLINQGTYTTTGVLEQVPTLENGGAEIRKADVYLDASGAITTTATQVITQVDQLVITYRWNPKLAWSDGQPVTADDSVFAYEHAKAAASDPDQLTQIAQTASYTALDAHTTQAVLKPDITGADYVFSYWTPLPKHLLEKAGEDVWQKFEQQPVGYGPYQIEQREPSAIRMTENPHYFGPKPANPKLDILFAPSIELLRANIANGNLDVIASERALSEDIKALDADAADHGGSASYAATPTWEHIDYNLDVPTLQDIRVRRAIALGTNRGQMVQDLLGGHTEVLNSWVLPFQPEAAPADQLTRYDYNPDQAKQQLDDAGYTDDDGDGIRSSEDGITLTLTLLTTSDSPLRAEIAKRFQADMRAIGVDVQISEQSAADLFDPGGPLYLRQFELALYGWKADLHASGLSLWGCNAVPKEENNFQGENFAGWCFRDADMAIRRGSTTIKAEDRNALYLKQQQMWTQELPALPLFQRLAVVATAKDVEGPKADTFAPLTWNVTSWRRTP